MKQKQICTNILGCLTKCLTVYLLLHSFSHELKVYDPWKTLTQYLFRRVIADTVKCYYFCLYSTSKITTMTKQFRVNTTLMVFTTNVFDQLPYRLTSGITVSLKNEVVKILQVQCIVVFRYECRRAKTLCFSENKAWSQICAHNCESVLLSVTYLRHILLKIIWGFLTANTVLKQKPLRPHDFFSELLLRLVS